MDRLNSTNICLAFLLVSLNALEAQTIEFQGTIKLKSSHKIFKLVTVSDCDQSYTPPTGSSTTVTQQRKLQNGKLEVVVESVNKYNGVAPITVKGDKEYKISVPALHYEKATLYQDEKDKSKLYINYFLRTPVILHVGTRVIEYSKTYTCGSQTPTIEKKAVRTLTVSETYSYKFVPQKSTEIDESWFMHSGGLEVLNGMGQLDYYLVNCYEGSKTYILELENRKFIPYRSLSVHLSALTIPFKVRFGFNKNDISVKGDVVANANIGLFGGVKTSRYYVINKAGTYTNKVSSSFRLGPFLSLSSVALDSLNSTVGKVPMKKDEKQNIAALSTGFGFMYELSGVQMGVFGGWDFAIGSESSNWNYHKKFWLGIGVGYKISDLFAQSN